MAIAISEVQGTIAVALAWHVFAGRAKAPKLFAVLRIKCVDARPRQAAHEGAGFTSHRPHDLGKGEAGIPRAHEDAAIHDDRISHGGVVDTGAPSQSSRYCVERVDESRVRFGKDGVTDNGDAHRITK